MMQTASQSGFFSVFNAFGGVWLTADTAVALPLVVGTEDRLFQEAAIPVEVCFTPMFARTPTICTFRSY